MADKESGLKNSKRANALAHTRQLWETEQSFIVGTTLAAGVDEAGRGCLAGPVYAAAVVLGGDAELWCGVSDSKRMTKAARESMCSRIRTESYAFGIGVATVEEIDRYNILQASLLAMTRAIQALPVTPELVLVDGPHAPTNRQLRCRFKPVIDGDAKCISISAASIVAKVERDRFMSGIASQYPEYGFDKHVGYGTPEHLMALDQYGPCKLHRRTFGPVRSLFQANLGLEP